MWKSHMAAIKIFQIIYKIELLSIANIELSDTIPIEIDGVEINNDNTSNPTGLFAHGSNLYDIEPMDENDPNNANGKGHIITNANINEDDQDINNMKKQMKNDSDDIADDLYDKELNIAPREMPDFKINTFYKMYKLAISILFLLTEISASHFHNIKVTHDNGQDFPDNMQISIQKGKNAIYINLQKNKDLSDTIPIEMDGVNIDNKESINPDVEHYYNKNKRAVISMKVIKRHNRRLRQITGSFDYGSKSYKIQPLAKHDPNYSTVNDHAITKINTNNDEKTMFVENLYKDIEVVDDNQIDTENLDDKFEHNQVVIESREIPEIKINTFYVELLFLLDHSVYEWYLHMFNQDENRALQEIRFVYGHIMNGITMSYASISFDKFQFMIKTFLKKIVLSKSQETSQYVTSTITTVGSSFEKTAIDGDALLSNLGEWTKQDGRTFLDPDHTMHFTKYNLFGDGTIGYAPVSGICEWGRSISTNEDAGINSWKTAQYPEKPTGDLIQMKIVDPYIEIYKKNINSLLGSSHDGRENGNNCDVNQFNIMHPGGTATSLDSLKNTYKFSECSILSFKKTLLGLTEYGFPRVCTFNSICEHGEEFDATTLPGEIYDLDKQCQIEFDEDSGYCQIGEPSENCYLTYCKQSSNNCYSLPYGSTLDGSWCGHNKWCIQGECVIKSEESRPKAISVSGCTIGKDFINDKTVPSGCTDYYSNCKEIAIEQPHRCLTEELVVNCCKSCHKEGIYIPDNFGTEATETTVPITTPTPTTAKTTTTQKPTTTTPKPTTTTPNHTTATSLTTSFGIFAMSPFGISISISFVVFNTELNTNMDEFLMPLMSRKEFELRKNFEHIKHIINFIKCKDEIDVCYQFLDYCRYSLTIETMQYYCSKSCEFCGIHAYKPISSQKLEPKHTNSKFIESKKYVFMAKSTIKTYIFSDESKFNLIHADGNKKLWKWFIDEETTTNKPTTITTPTPTTTTTTTPTPTTTTTTTPTPTTTTTTTPTSTTTTTTTPTPTTTSTTTSNPTTVNTESSCQDQLDNCSDYMNYCSDFELLDTMQYYCSSSCGLCGYTCEDQISQCDQYTYYCDLHQYGTYMFQNCKKTCNICDIVCYEEPNTTFLLNSNEYSGDIDCYTAMSLGYCDWNEIQAICCETCNMY
ncbi:hypothetical protein A3Q56_02058 [Intoshia linei]|uniref:ShKT domain-containing protein n=1 Tax=Intoshia linei TaxID=1819745 RepID=A0A177B7D5_9BILA|nr:hypothetical protein A3Q56_02058 [Intoshia linei]